MKILATPTSFLGPANAAARRRLEDFADEVVYPGNQKPLTEEEIIPLLEGVDGYIAGLDLITAPVLQAAPESLAVISRYGAGVDRVDLPAARARGIVITNTPGTNSTAVAELAFGLILACARNLVRLHADVEAGGWMRSSGMELRGKTLGILGLGAIGKILARFAQGFGMNVKACDPALDTDYCRAQGITPCDRQELLSTADVLSLHLPLSAQTRHIIDREALRSLKPGCILINTARGGLIDEAAAAEALRSGRLGGLGMDAFETEPPGPSPLFGLERTVFTPHTGAHTQEAVAAMGMLAVDNLIAVLRGQPCRYIVS